MHKAKKHSKKVQFTVKVKEEIKPLSAFWATSSSKLDSTETSAAEQKDALDVTNMVIPPPPPEPQKQTDNAKKSSSLSQFVTNDEVLSAEILWTLKTVMSHMSFNASSNTDKLFSHMFPDSAIAREFRCGKTKCTYLIRFGLAPYFKREVLSKVMDTRTVYVVSFDESLNKILQEEQMDLLLRFWDNERDKVVTRYFDSVFLGHARSVDLLKNFKIGLSKLTSSNLLQVSMDGPSTNWKFYESLLMDRK